MSEGHPRDRAANGRQGRRAIVAVLVLALLAAACESVTVTNAPGSPGATGAISGTVGPGESTPSGSGVIEPSPGGPDGVESAILPVPHPTLTDPFAIGEALYDPARMGDAVTSMLALMGVGIYRDDGTPIDTGAVTKAGDPWLFASEVWGLIEMGTDDLLEAPDDGPTYRLADLYGALQGLLPADLSLDAFIRAYADSYASHPDDLAPSLMLGQPIDEATPLTRPQVWLLFMDGFVELAPTVDAAVREGPVAAASRPRSGTASASLPQLIQPQSLTIEQWRELRAHFMTILHAIPFAVSGSSAHEGHGGPGRATQIVATVSAGPGFVSPVSGAVILQPGTGSLGGIQLTWRSPDIAIYAEHGTLAASIPGTVSTDGGGAARITYTPKPEAASGAGVVSRDVAKISATASARDLLVHAYNINDQSVVGFLMAQTLAGTRTARGHTTIEWHGPGINVSIVNNYDVTVDAASGIGGLIAFAHRRGIDEFVGTLTKRSDGTYQGVLRARTAATSEMEFVAGVAGDRCEDETRIDQDLEVVGRLVSTSGAIDPDLEPISSGSFGGQDLLLTFYPAGPPSSAGRCQGTVPYFGPGPTGRRIAATYASFSDSRFTDPSLGGFRIHLPNAGATVEYKDVRLAGTNSPDEGVDSIFTINVDRQPGS